MGAAVTAIPVADILIPVAGGPTLAADMLTPAAAAIPAGAATRVVEPILADVPILVEEATTVEAVTMADVATMVDAAITAVAATMAVVALVSASGFTAHRTGTGMLRATTINPIIAIPTATTISGVIGIPRPRAAMQTNTGMPRTGISVCR